MWTLHMFSLSWVSFCRKPHRKEKRLVYVGFTVKAGYELEAECAIAYVL